MNIDDGKTQAHVPLTAGTLVGHYRIVEKLGAGGMGEVYLAEDTRLNRQVALKFLPQSLVCYEDAKVRFTREAQATAQLNHPNIVTIYQVSEYKGCPFFAMEYCKGCSLRELVDKERLPLDRILDMAIQICEGLAKAHQVGIIHRDIKPSNIFIDADGRAKLLDFGLAALQGKDKLTKVGTALGTLGYMSPEQVRGEEADHRSDLFSLGVVIYEMVAGKAPFEEEYEASTIYAVLHEMPAPLARFHNDLPESLQKTVSRLLEKFPERRYQNANDVAADLKEMQRESRRHLAVRVHKRRWKRYAVIFAVPIILLIAGYWFLDSLPRFKELLKKHGASSGSASSHKQSYQASAWPEADQLFRRDPFWVGGDCASSVDLGDGRTLWLLGDTRVDPTGQHSRKSSMFIRNSVAIQTGYNPSKASIAFFWRKDETGQPASFFPEQGNEWFWPGHGIRLGDCLLLFLGRFRGSDKGLGFEGYDWDAVMVNNPDQSPSNWSLTWLDSPANEIGVLVGSASVIQVGECVYAFGSREPVVPHPIYVVRWPTVEVRKGDLSGIQWWAGKGAGWIRQADLKEAPEPVFYGGQTDLTVHYDGMAREFLCVQTVGFGPAVLALRKAPELTGPWTEPEIIYRPPEFSRPNIMIYAGKAHPQLKGADLVLTYTTNSSDLFEFSDSLIYYPRFVRLFRGR